MRVGRIEYHGQAAYILLDEDGRPVEEVARYMKHLFSKASSPHTMRTYCTGLKFFYEYLALSRLDYRSVKPKDLVDFVIWLRNPFSESYRVIKLDGSSVRAPRTTNTYVTAVGEFYRFLAFAGLVPPEQAAMLEVTRASKMAPKGSAGFLAHATNTHNVTTRNILKAKVPRKAPATLGPDDAARLVSAATNPRDEFLIALLLESGLRIGEALGLFIEDFRFDRKTGGYWVDVVGRGYHPNDGSAKTGGRSIPISRGLMEMFDDYVFDVLEEVGGPHPFVFVKLSGANAGTPLSYSGVRSAFDRYSDKIGVHVTPHVLRHTFGTLLYSETKDLKLVQELLGHASSRTTADIYLHPTPDEVYEEWSKASHRLAIGTLSNIRRLSGDGQ